MTLLADVVDASSRIAASSGRLAKTREIAALLARLDPAETAIAIPFLSGAIRQGKLAVGAQAIRDLRGGPALEASLGLAEVDGAFAALKAVRGSGAAAMRKAILEALFARSTSAEREFLSRLILGDLRQGALQGVMLEAVALAAALPADAVRRAVGYAGGLAPVAQAALAEGAAGLGRFAVRLMQPVTPMLAQPAADVGGAFEALRPALLDWKVDGARVQVHKAGEDVRVFTRSLNDVTPAVPEVVEAARALAPKALILDGEAIALRPTGSPQPFQVTMRRFGRKLNEEARRGDLALSVFFFDCLFADDMPLVDRPLGERRAALERAVPPQWRTPSVVPRDAAEARAFHASALNAGHEGVMVKALHSAYEAGRRGGAWLKVKHAHTLDLVVLAAEWGHGRRQGRLSNLHLGARDAAGGGFVMLGKTFKGLTDEMLAWQTKELLARESGRDARTVHVRPELVVEIAFDGIQESSSYPGGMALRFARVKGYRNDKSAAEADTLDTVRNLFEAQRSE